MNALELVREFRHNAVVSSLQVAESFGKRHDNILRQIENLATGLLKIEETPQMFFKSTYLEKQNGQKYPMYYMNRDGFSLLVMGFTGKKALEWKLKYIEAFNRMEKLLVEKQSLSWREARVTGKLSRHSETDALKGLVEYAKDQGSKHSDMLYLIYTKLANKMAGVQGKRDVASVKQLNTLEEIENMISHVVQLGMQDSKDYKAIYADCKQHLEQWQSLTFRKPVISLEEPA